MGTTPTRLVTVREFRELPETGPYYFELRHGELVRVTRPKLRHFWLQKRLVKLLEASLGERADVNMEFAFRALPEYELRVADVAVVSLTRIREAEPDDNLRGAPDVVIEVLSPSNSQAEIRDKEALCLENGGLEFWVVDAARRQVTVSARGGARTTFRAGERVPLDCFGGAILAVDDVFAGMR